MSDQKASSQAQKGVDFFQKLVEGQLDRIDDWYEQVEALQKKGFDQADQVMENTANLSRASISYAQELTQDFWRLSLDAVKDANETFGSKA